MNTPGTWNHRNPGLFPYRLHNSQAGRTSLLFILLFLIPPHGVEIRDFPLPDTRFWDYMAETTPLPPCIPGISRDQVEMHVHDRLSGSLTYINPDIVTGWMVPGVQDLFHAKNKVQDCILFFAGCIEKRRYVAEWDD